MMGIISRKVLRGVKIADGSSRLRELLEREGFGEEDVARMLGHYDVMVDRETALRLARFAGLRVVG